MRLDRLGHILLLLFCLAGQDGAAQWRPPVPFEVGSAHGLPAEVYDMTQDTAGFMYFGTNTGLYRYDGHTVEYFGHDPTDSSGIGRGDVYDVHVARNGQIWLALRFGGLNRFDPLTRTFYHHAFPDQSFRWAQGAYRIHEDPSGLFWIGGSTFRLMAFDPRTSAITTYTPDWINPEQEHGRLNIIGVAPDMRDPDLLWLTVLDYTYPGSLVPAYGLVAFNKKNRTFTPAPAGGQSQFVDEEGVIWGIAWSNLITRFDPATMRGDTFVYDFRTLNGWNRPLARDILLHEGRLLVLTFAALLAFDRKTERFEVLMQNPSTERLWLSLYADNSGNLWIGTSEGALVLVPEIRRIQFFSLGMFGTTKRLYPASLAYDPGSKRVLLAHRADSLSRRLYALPLDAITGQKPQFFETDYSIDGIAVDTRGTIWVAGGGTMSQADPSTGRFMDGGLQALQTGVVRGLYGLRANPHGWVYGAGREEFIWFHADRREVRRILADTLRGEGGAGARDGGFNGFFLGTGDRAYVYNRDLVEIDLVSGRTKRLPCDPRINPDKGSIRAVAEDHAGDLWISAFAGIGRLSRKGDSLVMMDRFTVRDGLISPIQEDMHVDHAGRVWTFSASGMNAIDPGTREVRSFGTQEGLPMAYIDAMQALNLPDGRVVTVCANGMIVFHPDTLWHAAASVNVPVVIRQVRLSGNPVILPATTSPENPFFLGPSRQVIDLEVQGLVFPTDQRVEYSYRLRGFQDEWIFIGRNRFITLPNLSPGAYVFEVKAGRPQAISPVTTVYLFVRARFHEWLVFRLGMAVALILGGYWIFRRRMQVIRDKDREKAAINQRMAELELSALRSQMNPHFMFNSLNSIKNYILSAEPRVAAEYLSDFAHLIRMILQHSRERTISLAEEIETLKLYVELEQLRFDEAFTFSCEVEPGLLVDAIPIPPMLLQPYLENAIWHGLMHRPTPGQLALQFKAEGEHILCVIDDNGIGREQAARLKSLSATRYKSLGMGLTRERIDILNRLESLGIQVSIMDKRTPDGRPEGTRVEVRLPGKTEIASTFNADLP